MQRGELTLGFEAPFGIPGIDQDINNPLSRAFARFDKKGHPLKGASLSFIREGVSVPRWLGVFIHSEGDRILFFPGGLGVCATGCGGFVVDHVTLDKSFRGSHFTSPGSADHFECGRPTALNENCYLWFGMSCARPEMLRIVMRKTIRPMIISESDLPRRAGIVKDAFQAGTAPLVRVAPYDAQIAPCFLHFSVMVGPRGFAEYQGGKLSLPPSPKYWSRNASIQAGLHLRRYRIALSPQIDLQVRAGWVPGVLNEPMIFAFPKK